MNLVATPYDARATVLYVQGNVDGETYGHLMVEANALVTRGTRCLILELSACEYMSSAGLMALTSIFKQMRDLTRNEAGASWATRNTLERAGELGGARELVLVNPSSAVARVLDLAGIPSYLAMYPTLAQAIAAHCD